MKLKNIILETTSKDLSALSGLFFFDNLMERLNLTNRLAAILPRAYRKREFSAKEKFRTGVLGFIAGAECIDDHKDLRHEKFFSQLTGGISPGTINLFLGKFKLKHFEKLQNFLPQVAYELRSRMFPRDKKLIITMDATPHDQYGEQEGVEWNYDKRWCYSSQNAFDERGFCYGWNLMNGSAHTSVGAVEMIERIFKNIKTDKERFFRADSGYGNYKIYNCLFNLGVHFTICLKENVWSGLLDRHEFSMRWRKTNLRFFDSDKCQIGHTVYIPKNLQEKRALRVVFVRAKKEEIKKTDKRHYRYYAIVTSIPSTEMSDEDIVRFYRGRANAENFIKDLKNGIDFKHFPCQKMNKNKAWGFMGIFAYNLMRFASFLIDPRGCYMKRVRSRLVYLASEIRKGQRKIKLRMSNYTYKEVKRHHEKLNKLFIQVYYRSGT